MSVTARSLDVSKHGEECLGGCDRPRRFWNCLQGTHASFWRCGNKSGFSTKGADDLILEAMKKFHDNAVVQIRAIGALQNLSANFSRQEKKHLLVKVFLV